MPSLGFETAIPAIAELPFGMNGHRDRLICFSLNNYDLSVQLFPYFPFINKNCSTVPPGKIAL
jgi:hypothetical protein